MAEVTITIPNSAWSFNATLLEWSQAFMPSQHIALGDPLSTDGMTGLYLGRLQFPRNSSGSVGLQLSNGSQITGVAGPDFSAQMESAGTISFEASDGSALTLTGISDSSEPYSWQPPNIAEVNAFANTLVALSDRSLTVTFNDNSNQPPIISNLVANPMIVASGGDVALTADVTDPNMDAVTYLWAADPDIGMFADASAEDTAWTAPTATFDRDVMLTLTAGDGADSSTASVSVTVQGIPRDVIPGDYCLLVDVNEDGGYALDTFPDLISLNASAGVFGVRRQGISAGAGQLSAQIWNNEGFYNVDDLKRKPIRLRYNGLYLWGGRVDDARERKLASGLRLITIKGLGALAEIGANIEADISVSGDTPASTAIADVTGLSVDASSEIVTDLDIDAGARKHDALRQIQNSSGTRLYEEQDGGLALTSEGIQSLWDLGLSVDDSLHYQADDPSRTIINAVIIDGTKYVDSDSVDEFGEVLHQGDFPFVKASEAQTIATNILSLYAEPRGLLRARYLMEYIAGTDMSLQNAILRDLHYGNGRLISFDDEGTARLVEILNVAHSLQLDGLHRITLVLRERETSGISLELNTYYGREVGYFVQLPPRSADGIRAIAGHRIEYRQSGVSQWTGVASAETGLVANDTFTVPAADEEYDIRAVAVSATGDEQITATLALKALEAEPRYQLSSLGSPPFGYIVRVYRLYTDKILPGAVDLRIIGFDWQARQTNWPEGWAAGFYDVDSGYAPPAGGIREYAVPTTSPPAAWYDNSGIFQEVLSYRQPTLTSVGSAIDRGAQLRFRPIFHAAGATLATGERGLWTPWLGTSDITVTY